MPLVVGVILWVLGVSAAVAIAAYVLDGGTQALAVILWVLGATAVLGFVVYALDRSTARQERKD